MSLSIKDISKELLDNFGKHLDKTKETICEMYGLKIVSNDKTNNLNIFFNGKNVYNDGDICFKHGKWEELIKEIYDKIPSIKEKQLEDEKRNKQIEIDLNNFKEFYKLVNIYNDDRVYISKTNKDDCDELLTVIAGNIYLYEKYNKNYFEFGIFSNEEIMFLVKYSSDKDIRLTNFDNSSVEIIYYEPGNWEQSLVTEIEACKKNKILYEIEAQEDMATQYIRKLKQEVN